MKSANLKKMWFAKMTNVNGKVKGVAKLAETDKEKLISSPFKISALLWYLWFFSSFTQIQIWNWKSNSQIKSIQFDSDGIFYQQNIILKVNFSKFPPRSTIMAHYVILCDVLPSVLYCKLTSSSVGMEVTPPSSLGINPVLSWSIPKLVVVWDAVDRWTLSLPEWRLSLLEDKRSTIHTSTTLPPYIWC